jgi:hypothetical protein
MVYSSLPRLQDVLNLGMRNYQRIYFLPVVLEQNLGSLFVICGCPGKISLTIGYLVN